MRAAVRNERSSLTPSFLENETDHSRNLILSFSYDSFRLYQERVTYRIALSFEETNGVSPRVEHATIES